MGKKTTKYKHKSNSESGQQNRQSCGKPKAMNHPNDLPEVGGIASTNLRFMAGRVDTSLGAPILLRSSETCRETSHFNGLESKNAANIARYTVIIPHTYIYICIYIYVYI
jgi:hypothetical protein